MFAQCCHFRVQERIMHRRPLLLSIQGCDKLTLAESSMEREPCFFASDVAALCGLHPFRRQAQDVL